MTSHPVTSRRSSVWPGILLIAATGAFLPFGLGAAVAAGEKRHVDARTGMLEVPIDELMAAIKRKDRAEIGRVAEQVGPARLAQSLRRSDSAAVLAALAGIAVLPGRTRLLGPVTELVVTGD
ncbi:MAG: hypothetical protein H7X95_14265, partial [Deltaproteobacteria bacterium]|nr:hypothetical protein [Deltaproteobacteria bacterium]